MAAVSLQPSDLDPFAQIPEIKAQAMIDDVLAMAALVAPCILLSEFEYDNAARAILRGAVLRWHEAGTGATIQQSAGPFAQSIDTKQERRGMFWPSEIEQLQNLCKGTSDTGAAFSIDTVPAFTGVLYDGTGYPIYCDPYGGHF